ncbi:MAG: hypothetical protein JW915_11505 [Chitinispirillaceae bacterium]|nr:hypothetical protein [Chitinispirillaceae bacterium]
MKKSIFILFLNFYTLTAQTPLSGAVENLKLTVDKSPYIIEDNLTIKETGQLTIEKGCVLLFKPFTGIIVEGSFVAEGTIEKPVIFTTINDNKFNKESGVLPNPFDWNGILITAKAKNVRLSNFILAYSVYGIRSMKVELAIKNGSFKNNGQFHMTVDEKIQPISDSIPFSYGVRDKARDRENQSRQKNKLSRALAISGGSCLSGAIASTVVLVYSRNKYSNTTGQENFVKFEKIGTTSLICMVVTGTAAAILIPSAVITYKKANSKEQQSIHFFPYYNEGPGILAQLLF